MDELPDLPTCVSRLTGLVTELAADHKELALVLDAEHQGRVATYLDSVGTQTQGVADKLAAHSTLNLTTDIFRLKGGIAAKEVEITYYTLLIDLYRNGVI